MCLPATSRAHAVCMREGLQSSVMYQRNKAAALGQHTRAGWRTASTERLAGPAKRSCRQVGRVAKRLRGEAGSASKLCWPGVHPEP